MERHSFDPVSFAFGALLVIAGLVLLTGDADSLALAWVGPIVAVGLGVLIVYAVRPRRRAPDVSSDESEADEGA